MLHVGHLVTDDLFFLIAHVRIQRFVGSGWTCQTNEAAERSDNRVAADRPAEDESYETEAVYGRMGRRIGEKRDQREQEMMKADHNEAISPSRQLGQSADAIHCVKNNGKVTNRRGSNGNDQPT